MFSGDEDDQEDSNDPQPDDYGDQNDEQASTVSSDALSSEPQDSSGDENEEQNEDEDEDENDHDDENESEDESEDDLENENDHGEQEQEDSSSEQDEDGHSMVIDGRASRQQNPSQSFHSSQTLQQSFSTTRSLDSCIRLEQADYHLDSYAARVARRKQIVTAPRKFLKPPVIDPLIFIPHGCPVHALALPPCGSHIFSGGQDGFIRRIAIYESVTGSTAENLTMKQGGHVPAIEKDGDKTTIFLTGYWENEDDERAVQIVHNRAEHSNSKHATRWGPKSVGNASKVSPVYSLVIQSEELWGLSGTESGNINLFTIRHDEGQIRHVFKAVDSTSGTMSPPTEIPGHKIGSVVSALELNHEQNVAFSGGWDGNVLGWDLNTGQVVNRFIAHASQISTVTLRPDLPSSIYDSKPMDIEFVGRASPKAEEPHHASEQASELGPVEQPTQSSPAKPSPQEPSASSDHDDDGTEPDGSLFGGSGSEVNNSPSYALPPPAPGPEPDSLATQSRTTTLDDAGLSPSGDGGRSRTVGENSDFFGGLTLPSAAPKAFALPTSTLALPNSTLALPTSTSTPALPPPAPKLPPTKLAQVPSVLDPSLPLLNDDVLLTSGIDGQVYLWDRRVQPVNGRGLVRKLDLPRNTAPWAASATWSLDGRSIFVGRRHHAVDVYDLRFDTVVQRTIRLPFSSGPVTCVKMWPDGNSLVCASFDNIRLWNLKAEAGGAKIPFKIIPGNSSGVVSSMCITPSERYFITASGDRGWENTSNECVVIHEVKAVV